MNKPVIIRPKDRNEWLSHRTKGIGSSEVATIIGVNPYETPYQLWLRKTNQAPDKPDSMAMMFGNVFEESVSTLFEKVSGRDVIKASSAPNLYIHPQHNWARVSPDRTYWLGEKRNVRDDSLKGVLECKITNTTIDRDDVPKHWFVQLQYQLGVMAMNDGSLAWATFHPLGFDFKDYTLVPDFFAYLLDEAGRFWTDCIKGGKEPALINAADVLTKYSSHTPGKLIEADQQTIEEIASLRNLHHQIKELESKYSEIEESVKMKIADAEGLISGGRTVCTWKASSPSIKVDTKQLKADHPDIVSAYEYEVMGSRKFLIK